MKEVITASKTHYKFNTMCYIAVPSNTSVSAIQVRYLPHHHQDEHDDTVACQYSNTLLLRLLARRCKKWKTTALGLQFQIICA